VHNFFVTHDHIIIFLTTCYAHNFSLTTNYAYNFFLTASYAHNFSLRRVISITFSLTTNYAHKSCVHNFSLTNEVHA
jgi:hypothetical protein